MRGDALIVRGGRPLHGTYALQGAKHSYGALLFGASLSSRDVLLKNVPSVSDVGILCSILAGVGVNVSRNSTRKSVRLQAWRPTRSRVIVVPPELSSGIRDSIYAFTLASRCSELRMSARFGGDDLGDRPIDTQIAVVEAMGYSVRNADGMLRLRRQSQARECFEFRRRSVSSTKIGLVMAATGDTAVRLENVALEPSVFDLIRFLRRAGAAIEFDDYATIRVGRATGRSTQPLAHQLIPDRIEAATVLAAVLACGGDVTITNWRSVALGDALDLAIRMGARITTDVRGTRIQAHRRPIAASLQTGFFPHVCTDMHPLLAVPLAVANGVGRIHETVFSDRWRYLKELRRMGVRAAISGNQAQITGRRQLNGADVEGMDIRASASLLIAALAAKGESRVGGLAHLRRGYENLPGKLRKLGAEIHETALDEQS